MEEDGDEQAFDEAQFKELQEQARLERYEVDLLNAEDASDMVGSAEKGTESPQKRQTGGDSEIMLGLLSKQGHITPETYEFINMWLKFIIINKTKESMEASLLKG